MSVVPQPVAPDSVRVWRGYRKREPQVPDTKSLADFAQLLGSVFVPACALLQPKAGLCAYVPSLLMMPNKPATVPDQTALMFWANTQAHDAATMTVAVRAYQGLHGDVYDTALSSSQPPIALASPIKAEQPYYLIKRRADWMLGSVRHFVGARAPALAAADFLAKIGKWAAKYQKDAPAGVDGALLCAGNDYVAFWEHRAATGKPAAAALGPPAALASPCLDKTAETYVLPAGLWDSWPGIELTRYDCINIQLARPGTKSPRGTTR